MDHLYNINKIQSKLKTRPKLYKVYNFIMGMPGQLTVEDLKEIKKLTNEKHRKFIATIDREIKNLTPKKANNSKKALKK